jgi:hypothetical protein
MKQVTISNVITAKLPDSKGEAHDFTLQNKSALITGGSRGIGGCLGSKEQT